jgi:F0F1-type ATP synthase assembly protein I
MPDSARPPNPWTYASAGLEFVCTFGLLVGLGIVLDLRLNMAPLLTATFGLLGFGIALRNLLRRAKRGGKEEEDFMTDKMLGPDRDGHTGTGEKRDDGEPE